MNNPAKPDFLFVVGLYSLILSKTLSYYSMVTKRMKGFKYYHGPCSLEFKDTPSNSIYHT